MSYLSKQGAKIISAYVIKKRGEEPVFLCSPIDREEAAASKLKVVTMNKYNFEGILREKPDRLAAAVELARRAADLGCQGLMIRKRFDEFRRHGKIEKRLDRFTVL